MYTCQNTTLLKISCHGSIIVVLSFQSSLIVSCYKYLTLGASSILCYVPGHSLMQCHSPCTPHHCFFFDLILYVPSTIVQLCRDGSSWVEPVVSKDTCVLLKDHNAVTPVRLEPANLGLESSTLPLSHCAPYLTVVLGYSCPSLQKISSYLITAMTCSRTYTEQNSYLAISANWSSFIFDFNKKHERYNIEILNT